VQLCKQINLTCFSWTTRQKTNRLGIVSNAGMCLSDSDSMSDLCVALHSLLFHCGLEKTASRQPLIKTKHSAHHPGHRKGEPHYFPPPPTPKISCKKKIIICWHRYFVKTTNYTHTFTQSWTNTQYVLLGPWEISNLSDMWLYDWLHTLLAVKLNYSLTLMTFWLNA